jgi:acyl-CoA thioesterase I
MIKKLFYLVLPTIIVLFSCGGQSSDKKATNANNTDTTKGETVTSKKVIVFFGNSLTAAFGLNVSEGFAGRIEQRLDSMKADYKVIHAGNSGETTAGGVSRVEWVISRQKVDIFVLELGGNDALRGLKSSETEKNLQEIITKVKAKYPDCKIVLAGMYAPTNMGKDYTKSFQAVYPALAKKNNLALIPFLLEGVGGVAKLNQADGIHPTVEGHRIVTENVWGILKRIL